MRTSEDVDRGWAWVVAACSFLIHVMTYGLAWSTGVYNVIFLEAFGQPKSVTAWAGSLPTAMMYAAGPVASVLTNKFGFRPVIMVGGVLASAGLCLSYFATSLYYLFFTLGVLTGVGLGIVYIPAISAISFYFNERLPLASGIAASGVGVGNFLYPPVIRWLVITFDWKSSFLVLGGLTLNICVLGALIRPVKRMDIPEKQPVLDFTPFKKRGYVMLCVNVFLFCCGISALYIHLVSHAEQIAMGTDRSAWLISGLGIANLIGRLLYGAIVQQPAMNPFLLYAGSFGLAGVCICLVPFMTTYWSLMTVAVCFGLMSGCFGTLLVPILIRLLGLQRFANGYGCLLLFMAGGQLIGAFIAGAMYDITNTYTWAFVLGGSLSILSAVIMVQPYCYVKNHEQHVETLNYQETNSLADSIDLPRSRFPSHRAIVPQAVSLESLVGAKRALELQRSRLSLNIQDTQTKKMKMKDINTTKLAKNDNKPVNMQLMAVQLSASTKTI